MNKLFLIVLPASLDRDKVIAFLETNGVINFWFYNLPSSFFARSHSNSKHIYNLLITHFKPERLFIINIKADMDYTGMVPENHIEYFKNI